MKVRGVLFDLDFTLLDNDRAWQQVWPSVAERFEAHYSGFDADEFWRRASAFGKEHYQLVHRGEMDVEDYRRSYLRHGLQPWGELDDGLVAAYNDARSRAVELVEPYGDAVATLRSLRQRGLKLGILTNGPSDLQRRKLLRIGVREVDAVAVSAEIKAWKPEPEAYRCAAAMLGLAPNRVAMVGDHLTNDVVGAMAAGVAIAVWVERRPGKLPKGAVLARELADLPGLLRT